MIPAWTIPAIAYLLGSIPFGLLIVKMSGGGDVRAIGQRKYWRGECDTRSRADFWNP